MEAKLIQAADNLPKPKCAFCDIEQAAAEKKKTPRKSVPMMRLVWVALLIASLCTTAFAYGSRSFGLWSGMHSFGYGDVVLLNWKYDYHFPEELMGLPFNDVSTLYGAPHGATHLEALLRPTYTYHSVGYGVSAETGSSAGQQIRIGFGSNRGENWKYHFSVGEDGFCNHKEADTEYRFKMEYAGFTLYVCACDGSYHIRWEDDQHQMVLRLSVSGYETMEEAVEIAKELIDGNR